MKLKTDSFLKNFWQKQPLVIRQAIPDFSSPIDANELAGLALEEEVESRIILENGNMPWELKTGPFSEKDFAALPESGWTLLVQAVNHFYPGVHQLLEYFDFLPRWRLDDIMISYATDGGSVGPHYDHYDVFLLQAQGKRLWKVGPEYNESSDRLPHPSLKILSEFTTLEEYILEPGDMLYLPPGVGHHGIAQGECITISIGFRAPSHQDILMGFTDFVSDQLPDHSRYSDPDLQQPENPCFIDEAAIERVQSILQQYTGNKALIGQWFGELMTQPKYCLSSEDNIIDDWNALLEQAGNSELELALDARIACDHHHFYANGVTFHPNSQETLLLTHKIARKQSVTPKELMELHQEESQQLLVELTNSGVLNIRG